jgi:hypothetical protein
LEHVHEVKSVPSRATHSRNSFSWTRSPVALSQDRQWLVLTADTEEPSDAPALDALWLRLAALPPTDEAMVAAANEYGFLTRTGESVFNWLQTRQQLREIAQLWGEPADLALHELRFSKGGDFTTIRQARELAHEMRRTAIIGDGIAMDRDIKIVPGLVNYEVQPRTLFGLLTVQVADALAERPLYRRCAYCAGWFAVRRSDQLYCQPKHRGAKAK